jgi:hypothetical protein
MKGASPLAGCADNRTNRRIRKIRTERGRVSDRWRASSDYELPVEGQSMQVVAWFQRVVLGQGEFNNKRRDMSWRDSEHQNKEIEEFEECATNEGDGMKRLFLVPGSSSDVAQLSTIDGWTVHE